MALQNTNPGLEHTNSSISSLTPSIQTPSTANYNFHSRQLSNTSSVVSSTTRRKNIVRRSLSVFERLPKDFSSLIRSHSVSHRCSTQFERDDLDATNRALTPGYADSVLNNMPLRPSLDMKPPCPQADDERPTRKTTLENRLYNFLTRSRSRSRSKREQDSTESSTPPSPEKSQRHMRRSSLTQNGGSPHTPTRSANGTKPISRIPSRPLSSTTTATNTTITPGTPKAKRRTPSAIPVSTPPAAEVHENAVPQTTPKPLAAKKRLQNLFGIPLALAARKSSRSRSRSRPNSPQPSLDIPPLPTAGFDDDPTPKHRKSYSPHPSRPPSPATPSKPRPSDPISNATSTGSTTSNSLRLPKFLSGRTAAPSESNGTHRPSISAAAATTSKSAIPVVSAPLRRTSHRRSQKPESNQDSSKPAASKPIPPSTSSHGHTTLTSNLPPPQIIHTPATPLKNQPTSDSKLPPPAKGRVAPHHVAKNNSMDSGYRYRGGTMGVLDEEDKNHLDVAKTASLKGKTREKEASAHLRTSTNMSIVVRNTKHGSFDFERPGWSASVIQRTGSSGTTATTASNRSKSGERETHYVERESAFGPGLAGVGTLQREMSLKRMKDTEEQIRARERARKLQEYVQKDKIPPIPPKPQASSSGHSDHLNGSTSTNGTAHTNGTIHTAKSSSLSKATGKRSMAGSRAGGSGVGLSRLLGATQHPLFAFEPPVPSPTWSTGSNGAAHETSQNVGGKLDKEGRLKEEVKRRDAEKKTVTKGDRPPVPVPLPSGHRPDHRGRSLDLGLGLAWAPSTMKEAALLPSSTLFARSTSGSSSVGRSTSGSTMGRTASSSTNGHDSSRSRRVHIQDSDVEGERSQLGKEVAEVFRNILNDRGYNTFKSYVQQFDSHEIPFDGPAGIVERVERLLAGAPEVSLQDRRLILEKFVRVILQNA